MSYYCPFCNGQLHVGDRAVFCTMCSMVSEVSPTTGKLIDLGNITLDELDAPFVPGVDEPRIFIPSSTTILWRRDS